STTTSRRPRSARCRSSSERVAGIRGTVERDFNTISPPNHVEPGTASVPTTPRPLASPELLVLIMPDERRYVIVHGRPYCGNRLRPVTKRGAPFCPNP